MSVIETSKLGDLAAALSAAGYRVVVPADDGDLVRLRAWSPDARIRTDAFTVNSAKDFFLPPCEVIGRFDLDGDGFALGRVQPDAPRTVLLGVRACDAAALGLTDKVFNWDCEDAFYNARRAATTVVTLACTSCDASCFCTSVGGRPDGTAGADAILRPADGGSKLVFEALSDKGRAVAAAAGGVLGDGQAAPDPAADVPVRFETRAVAAWLADVQANFDSPLWRELSLPCLGCGACTYACPACHCFDIQDESTRTQAVRYRCWDTCGVGLFTQHAGGHNPRPDQTARWRNRVCHKFSYIPQRFALLGCTGCGRCRRLCPAGMDIVEVCRTIQARAVPG